MLNKNAALFEKIDRGEELTLADLTTLLHMQEPEELHRLFSAAYEVKKRHVGTTVYYRGIIEAGNICVKDCYYCGIRRSNSGVERFLMDPEEIVREALWCYENHYGSLVIQSGERQDGAFTDMITGVIRRIRAATEGKLGITLSLGEQSRRVYDEWFQAGAHRYLLRIETSNPALYTELHPGDHSFSTRLAALRFLQEAGYQVGTGVMMGLPGQTMEDLARDILFLRDFDIDMVGMGPYIPHKDTPLGAECTGLREDEKKELLLLAKKMIALVRIVLNDVNIAATTALQALKHDGREEGLLAGANIIMPNVTKTDYRPHYQLYENKPCIDENSTMCRGCLEGRIGRIGETIGYDEWGDSPHFFRRSGRVSTHT
ncbi:[FeFe] hydrogenase H-cluster radical SAM maturase HydE [Chitinivibrio alkaliphilus]|uniref:Radical SAM domain protein n=1 Tax=Chitinivibrio alkaliphilus ACht1 TaxID=1313304 RepID=U7D563_9BACT|nr:[FeFe] hydrogenase H-cluster radical SAM maturase HydE [Chitinivibrio alkaliphilus]ERP31083.1 Radical SAM domain protein [Chitinivibrio alkaliphilus ACht1]